MTIASQSGIRAAIASIVLAAALCPLAVANSAPGPTLYPPTPAHRALNSRPAPPMRMATAVPAKPGGPLTKDEQKRIAAAMNQLPSADRKRLAKAMKHLTPDQRRQFLAVVNRQSSKK